MVDDATWFQSIQSTIAALARTSKALLIVLKPYVQRGAEGDVSSVEKRVGSDADPALYDVGVHGGHLAHGALPALLAVADGHLSHQAAHDGCVE